MVKVSKSNNSDLLNQTSILSQALPFMQKYAGKNVTIKFGGSAMGKDKLSSSFAKDIVLLKQVGINPLLFMEAGHELVRCSKDLRLKVHS